MEYKSSTTLLGMPLVHVAIGAGQGPGPRGIAKGWIAVGDVAFGVLFAAGGVAFGGLAIGGLGVGGLALGGASIGLWSVGGLALGLVALGGAAIAVSGAVGGVALAIEHAMGGLAIAAHSNDAAAKAYFESGRFLGLADVTARLRDWLVAVAVGVVVVVWMFRGGQKNSGSS